jgi:hypothetical protein
MVMMFQWNVKNSCHGWTWVPVRMRERALAWKLRLKRKAKNEALINYPPATATEPSAAEVEIDEAMGALHQEITDRMWIDYRDHQVRCLATAAARCQEERFTGSVAEAEGECENLHSGLDKVARAAWDRVREARASLAQFREVHGIGCPPDHFEGQLWQVAKLLTLVVAEGLFNAYSFSKGVEGGLLEGFAMAFMVSATTVVLSASCGFLLRWKNHRWPSRRMLALTAVTAWVPVIVGWALLAGHLRSALVAGSANPGHEAVLRLCTHPLALQEFDSIALVLISLVFAVFALCEGYRLDDPVPGYGALARKVAAAERDYADLEEAHRATVEDIIAQGHAGVQDDYEDAREARAAYQAELHDSLDMLRNYISLSHHLALTCVRLKRRYREINQLYRTERAPAYFHAAPTVSFKADPELAAELDQTEALLTAYETDEALNAKKNEAERALAALAVRSRDASRAVFDRIEQEAMPAQPLNGHAR